MELKFGWNLGDEVPDESYLRELDEVENNRLRRDLASERETGERRHRLRQVLLNSAGQEDGILLRTESERSDRALREAEANASYPSVNQEQLHRGLDDLIARFPEVAVEPGEHIHSGHLKPSGAGWWWKRNGERAEESPMFSSEIGIKRFNLYARAKGEGDWDTDYTIVHGFLNYRLHPPTWGHLIVWTRPWLHGYYSLSADDDWWNDEYAVALVDTWIDVHQHFWRGREYVRRFELWGHDVHPAEYDRIDEQYQQNFYTDVAEADRITIRVGVKLYSKGRAAGSHSVLDFSTGAGNYVYVPDIEWMLWRYD